MLIRVESSSQMNEAPDGATVPVWMLAVILPVLTGVIALLWKMFKDSIDEKIIDLKTNVSTTSAKLDKCEEDHEKTRQEFTKVNREVGELNGRLAGLEAAHKSYLAKLVGDDGEKA